MKMPALSLLAGTLALLGASPAAAQSGRHVPARQVTESLPDSVMGGSGSATFSHRQQQGDTAVWVRIENTGDCVMGVVKQRLRTGRRGRDRFVVQPGATVYARYERQDFDVTLSCGEPMMPGGECDGGLTMIPVRRGEADAMSGRLGEIEIYSGSPMPAGASCGDAPVELPLIHVKYGRARLDATIENTGSPKTGCTTFEVTTNDAVLALDFAGGGPGMGSQWFDAVEDSRLMARCTGGGGGCQGTLRLTLTP